MSSTPFLITLTTFLILLSPTLPAEAATPAAPGPTPAPLNFTDILAKGGQYTTFLGLLNQTQVGVQIQSQLNNSNSGLTVFAPTDNAFNNLKPGTLNSLTAQDQVTLVLYHVLPKYYDFTTFPTASNPVPTEASGHNGVYSVNITSTTNQQVNVSTGVDETRISNGLYSTFPLSVFSVDQVLLPYELFGAKPPVPAMPAASPSLAAAEPTGSTPAAQAPSSGFRGRGMVWGFVVGVVMLIGVL